MATRKSFYGNQGIKNLIFGLYPQFLRQISPFRQHGQLDDGSNWPLSGDFVGENRNSIRKTGEKYD
jgi:hypothetical protein